MSRFGVQAKFIIGGGPQSRTRFSADGGNRDFSIISALTKPEL